MVEKARNSSSAPQKAKQAASVSPAGNACMPTIDLFEIILVIEGEFMLLLICKRKILNGLVLIFQ